MTKKALIYTILFFIMVFGVAAQEDFLLTAEPNVDLCPCSNQGYPIFIENTGSVSSTYDVSFGGDASEWASAAPYSFSIDPGVKSYFFVYINSECNIKGYTDLDVNVQANTIGYTVKQNLSFVDCYKFDIREGDVVEVEDEQINIPFTGHIGPYNICERDNLILPVLITNEEDYGNTYEIELNGPEWTSINIDEFELSGKKKGLILVNLAPGTELEGEYKLKLEVTTKLGDVKEIKELDIDVDKCYGLIIDIEEDSGIACSDEETVYDVVIENDGNKLELLEIGSNLEWARIGNFSSIRGNSKSISSLILNPTINDTGTYDLELDGFVKGHPGVNDTETLQIQVVDREDCYSANFKISENILNMYTEEYYDIEVENTGLKESTFTFDIKDAESWMNITPSLLELKPGESGNVNLYVNPNENVEKGIFIIKIAIVSGGIENIEEITFELKEENTILKKIKDSLSYFQYYIYALIVLIIIIILLFKPIMAFSKKAKKRYDKYSEKKEKQRKIDEEKRKKIEEKEKKKEQEEKIKEEKKAKREEKKKAEKIAKKKPKINFFNSALFKIILVVVILLVLGIIAFYFFYDLIIEFLILYSIYFVIGIAILGLIIFGMSFYRSYAEKKKK